jgi:hypothetical protein
MSDKKSWQSLQAKVQELEKKLRESQVKYHFFYSTVLIDSSQGTLQANQALESMSWLFYQINQQINFSEITNTISAQSPPILATKSIKNLVTALVGLVVISTQKC